MVTFESMGFVDAGYARVFTERFIMFLDGEPIGIKDEWMDGRIFAKDCEHETYAFDCADAVVEMLKQAYPECYECEPGDGAIFSGTLSEEQIREIVLKIRHLSKMVA